VKGRELHSSLRSCSLPWRDRHCRFLLHERSGKAGLLVIAKRWVKILTLAIAEWKR